MTKARRSLRAIVLACLAASCTSEQEAKVTAALREKFPNGHERCLPLRTGAGIDQTGFPPGILSYPASGITAPDRHLFVLWSGRASDPVPGLVAELTRTGQVTRHQVEATTDEESASPGPQMISPQGVYYHPTLFQHRIEKFPVDIYLTAAFDPRFRFDHTRSIGGYGRTTFPSRLYDTKLPPPDQHYLIPTGQPYATSIVTAACLKEKLVSVDKIEEKTSLFAGTYVEATISYQQDAPEWMKTPQFRRAAFTESTPPIDGIRKVLTMLRPDGDKYVFVEENPR